MKKVLFSLFFLMEITMTAAAAPSLNGYTGMIDNPSADVLRPGHYSLGYYSLHDGSIGTLDLNVARGVELGVVGFQYNEKSNKAIVNAKFSLVPEKILEPGVAIGIEDVAGVNKRSAYVVASKALPFGFRLHAGLGNGRIEGAFASLEKTVNPGHIVSGGKGFPTTTLILEHNGKNLNYGARMSLTTGLKLDAGWRSHDFYVGMSFTK